VLGLPRAVSGGMGAWFDILVVGGANFDYLIKARSLPAAGETIFGDALYEAPGGKGANQAIAAARLGARTAFVGRVGDDGRGQRVLARLAEERVATEYCVIDREASTGVALIVVDDRGEKMIATAPGANHRLAPADLQRAAPLFGAAKVVLLQLEPGYATALAAARRARDAGALVVLDAAPPIPQPTDLLELVDVVRANAGEAHVLTGIRVDGLDAAREAALALRRPSNGAACVATSRGDLLVFGDGDEVWLPRQPVRAVDSTGAGDAFAAGLAVGLAEDRSLIDAGWLGCAAAALKTTRVGAQAGLPARGDVDRFLGEIRRDH
jgi:ribokinase